MSIHIEAEAGAVAPAILLPGDPLRAKFIAETFLDDAVCFNRVRGMLGYTGRYDGTPVSVMGTGMGMPSLSIYVNELVKEFGVKRLVRVGTCGGLQPDMKVGDVVLPLACSTDADFNRQRFGGRDYAPAVTFELLRRAHEAARARTERVHVGGILATDTFYHDDPDWWRKWAEFGVLAVEMETSALFTLAAKFGVEALTVLTVSDSLASGEFSTAAERERGFPLMAEIALAVAAAP